MDARANSAGRHSGLEILGLLSLVGAVIAALALLGGSMVTTQVSIGTSKPLHLLHRGPSSIKPGLRIDEHWKHHEGQKMNVVETYKMLLAGECAMVARYCDEYDPNRKLHLCLDPVSQLIGGIYVVGDLIVGGHAGEGEKWWSKVIRQSEGVPSVRRGRRTGMHSVCPDGVLR